jgi:hypothetical protein
VTTAAAEAGDEEDHHGDSDANAVDIEEDFEKQIAKETRYNQAAPKGAEIR